MLHATLVRLHINLNMGAQNLVKIHKKIITG